MAYLKMTTDLVKEKFTVTLSNDVIDLLDKMNDLKWVEIKCNRNDCRQFEAFVPPEKLQKIMDNMSNHLIEHLQTENKHSLN